MDYSILHICQESMYLEGIDDELNKLLVLGGLGGQHIPMLSSRINSKLNELRIPVDQQGISINIRNPQ